MQINPLTAPIAQILRDNPDGLSEYQLLGQLEFDGLRLDDEPGVSAELLLFRKHFLVMNALYRLQPVMWEEGCYLSISALCIALQPVADSSDMRVLNPAGEEAIRDYYLDWNEFEQSSSESVEQLLNSFWQRYFADDKRLAALAVFELDADCSWSEIRSAYRRQAAIHHPDRGGDSQQFRQAREAYELLACCRS
ncbi:MAG: DNA-J related domain-containing protein [Halopseudomonas sp.]